ncbi:alpha-N-acetylgalactosaminidase isoform X1 [Taeniopygia guttata]|uniref:alpha-N-acetylgalactosaminidase isoform X1 n=1 Tax=Taeniopygia guttata TaxID=59729 RepID=UPI003BB96F14
MQTASCERGRAGEQLCAAAAAMEAAVLSGLVLALALALPSVALENGLARTPPMGWMSWERFRCNVDCQADPRNCISEQLFFEMADRLAEDGWRELGYEYINLDDCWAAKQRDAAGQLVPDPKRFPRGIKALTDYVHARGLKLGIYGDLGIFTCGGYPGTMLENVKQDAQTFAAWGVDMLKLDGCYSSAEEQAKGYPEMARALNATGRPIVYSCSWPAYQGGLPPQLIIGNFGLSYEQSRSQMALWTVMAAPLLMSTDLRTISPEAKEILQNRLMIQINQDPLGIQGRRIVKEKYNIEVFVRPLAQAASALVFFSRRTDMPFRYTTSLAKLHFPEDAVYEVQDVYVGKIIGDLKTADNFSVVINPSGVVMWYLHPKTLPVQPWHVVRQQAPGGGYRPALL